MLPGILRNLNLPHAKDCVIDDAPAERWEESMISGNGTLGVMVPGHLSSDVLTFGHERLFLPIAPKASPLPLAEHRETLATFLKANKAHEATELLGKIAKEHDCEKLVWTDPLVPGVNLCLELKSEFPSSQYARSTNFKTGEVTAIEGDNDSFVMRKIFVSRADGVAVCQMRADGNPFSCRMKLTSPPPIGKVAHQRFADCVKESKATVKPRVLQYQTIFTNQWNGNISGHSTSARVLNSSGKQRTDDQWLYIDDTEELLILLDLEVASVPSLPNPDVIHDRLMKIQPDYEHLLTKHVQLHEALYNRVSLELGSEEPSSSYSKETLKLARSGSDVSPIVAEKLFSAARYVVISSTGQSPPTLQGIWGNTWRPPWSGDFTWDGNVQSVIAAGLSTNLPEVVLSTCSYLESHIDDFRINARKIHGCRGIMVPARTSSHGIALHYSQEYPLLYWLVGSAWVSWFFYDYWLYSQDIDFLRERALPFMMESAEFYEDYLTLDDEGKVSIIPSYSPENTPSNAEWALCINATMDLAVIRELFTSLIDASRVIEIDSDIVENWKKLIQKFPSYSVAKDGSFSEWLHPFYEENHQHRHASQLYPFFNIPNDSILDNQDLKKACQVTLQKRMEYRTSTSGVMAFGIVQLGLAATNLQDKKHSQECLNLLCSEQYWSPALVSFHDPKEIFNVDICGGMPAVLTQMLLLSTTESIKLLPSLPSNWPNGHLKGICARGGFKVDVNWKEGELIEARITASTPRKLRISYKDHSISSAFEKGQTTVFTKSSFT